MMTDQPASTPPPDLHKPEVPEVLATRQDVEKPSVGKRLLHFLQQIRKQGILLTVIESYEQITRLTTGAPTLRYSRVLPNLHIGGQFSQKGWMILSKRGITAVISMRVEFDDREAGLAPERYLYLPTVDNHAPTTAQLHDGVIFIRAEIERGGKVYIHCWEGVGRAPTMAAAYLVSTGLSPTEAWATISRVRPFVRPLQPQVNQIIRFAAICSSGVDDPTDE
jgi:predicted protein tyrosine phosphatase